ncbi:MAG: hypothetical protein M2R45_01705 [Verrucomicrobia subdivision 3 bacterium]|nr:hypothetical protein [Limisphaerales bacterium]MCS1413444.1 hypothetical protein [Limisphaerales bacterium]
MKTDQVLSALAYEVETKPMKPEERIELIRRIQAIEQQEISQ